MKTVASEDPAGFVRRNGSGPLVIDEIQKVPSLLPEIKLAVDENTDKGQYLVTGSANIKTLPSVTESLAGRMGTVRLRPLAHGEVAGNSPTFVTRAFSGDYPGVVKDFTKADVIRLAFRGGYGETLELPPRAKRLWFKSYLDAMLLHDIRELMDVRAYQTLRKMAEDLFARSAKFFDFKNLAWFRDNVAKGRAFSGIVLYAGTTTLPFGKDLYAVPLGAICQ